MAHPLFWPGEYYFYPIGNTSAVCLTRDLALEDPSNILLLGCGDPRNILCTIYNEPQKADRRLDFTCCDMDPAVLARNVLLFTMVADQKPYSTTVWNMFFHVYLDEESYRALIEQCKKLIELSGSVQDWEASPYGSFIKISTEHTLLEVRRHWSLYVAMHDLPHARLKAIEDAFLGRPKLALQEHTSSMGIVRSAGPLMIKAMKPSTEIFQYFWNTGVTDPNDLAARRLLNPTFFYSLAGEGCSIQKGTNPLVPFHFAELFGNATGPVSAADMVKAAKAEFSNWCSAFHEAVNVIPKSPVIRLFLGEAIAVCRSLRVFATTGMLDVGVPVMQWKTQPILLNKDEYTSGHAPVAFNVIETSNLIDHIGLLNVLIAATPLLSNTFKSSVLHTESLLFREEDATKEFTKLLHGNITAVALLLNICPVDYLSGFTTRSNTHEWMLHRGLGQKASQFHQTATWKSPTSGDPVASRIETGQKPPLFDPRQLGTFLYDMYQEIFEQENPSIFSERNARTMQRAISQSNLEHYTRETFVLLLRLVRDRLGITQEQWLDFMNRFIALREEALPSVEMDSLHSHELITLLHHHGVYTRPVHNAGLCKVGRFSEWDVVPPLVRITLTVPRKALEALENSRDISTPLLECALKGGPSHDQLGPPLNMFTAVHVTFGRIISMGTSSRPKFRIEEDMAGFHGTSSLLASFTVPAGLLTSTGPMENQSVCLRYCCTMGNILLVHDFKSSYIFSAKLSDKSHVHIMAETPSPPENHEVSSGQTSLMNQQGVLTQIGTLDAIRVELDEQCELVASLTGRVSVDYEEVRRLFSSGITPEVKQVSPCVIQINIRTYVQDVVFPFPIVESQHRLRLARKSFYIEVVVPVAGPFGPDGMKLNPFSVVGTGGTFRPWNIHRLNLAQLPVLETGVAIDLFQWLNPHVSSMMSSRERSLRKKQDIKDPLTFVKDTLHTIFVRSCGIQGGPARRLFAMHDHASATKHCDTMLFISDVRFDLHSHTMVCDGYVLTLLEEIMPKIHDDFARLLSEDKMVHVSVLEGEVQAWKQLLPAFVERCRSSWSHGENCEYRSQRKIPLTTSVDADPLCSCGRGKDVEGMLKEDSWKNLAPYVTRVAFSPLFAVSYLEAVGRDPAAHRCSVCRGKGKPKMMKCTGCKVTRYCSRQCQKKDWKAHQARCKS